MKEIFTMPIEIYKKYEVEDIDSKYFLEAIELLKEEYPKDEYRYTRFFQRLGSKTFMHIRIIYKNV